MNDVIDALNSRIKSPYFGYSVLAFFALNWRGLFLLITDSGSAQERLTAFDGRTSVYSLVIFPLIAGALVAILSPWIRYIFAYLSRVPFELSDSLSLNLEHKKALQQAELERVRTDMFAVKEEELIERARRDQEIEGISDNEVKEKLSSQIEDLRKQRDKLSEEVKNQIVVGRPPAVSGAAHDLLKAASETEDGEILNLPTIGGSSIDVGFHKFGVKNARDFAQYEAGLRELVSKGYALDHSGKGEVFTLTHEGWSEGERL